MSVPTEFTFGSEPAWLLHEPDFQGVLRKRFTLPTEVLTPEEMTRLHEQVEPWWRISKETERVVPGPFRDFIRYYGSWNASDPPDPDCPAVEGLHSPKDYFAVLAVLNDTATWFLFSTTGGYGGYPDVLEAALASPEQLKVWVTG